MITGNQSWRNYLGGGFQMDGNEFLEPSFDGLIEENKYNDLFVKSILDQDKNNPPRTPLMKLILKLAGLRTSQFLKYFDLHIHSLSDRFYIIKTGIEKTPNVKCVIDRIVEGMADFMSAERREMEICDPMWAPGKLPKIVQNGTLSSMEIERETHMQILRKEQYAKGGIHGK